ncbi:MAG TPA: CaiB/BaiF CoA-transferase family protein [Paracoccus sp. (in: a-proteobacteria)]|uniref:CaiB/BaiF CoA transferase family protein n=1 Tax=uncultured Paracoccus sp. TaxID=189685 RepID=UPI00262CFBBF|nr:CaiB/BaiF CoA-transferase family protein [uncultured Paracoccus sp.]HMQ41650.1 CaiB/BaiF CoA-transferase family protein [Paracoccus sp. (in: a-proteobacteria)]HMR34678.1 CaiB/BaiF CoA-transferase family protein [Paracoccus sp. (in: a-proteobacteria)]
MADLSSASAPPDPQDLPLAGLVVVDLSQFLSGPYCSLRLSDLGARVIKVERPGAGDLSRQLYLSDTEIGGDSTIFHAINRGKESIALDLKDAGDLAALKRLLAQADVVIQNFRPGVAARMGLDWPAVQAINPRIVYGSISGYGTSGPWVGLPGQDLLAQARSGLTWLSGDAGQGPVPMGLAVADMMAGVALSQGILAALVGRGVSGRGRLVETSLLEALIDLQFEVLTTYLNDGRRLPSRAARNSAHAYLSAPYGVYACEDGHLALAMTPLPGLFALLDMPDLTEGQPDAGFRRRDEIKEALAERLSSGTVAHWLSILQPADIWCAEVMNWPELLASEGFARLDMLQLVTREDGVRIRTTRSPLTLDGRRPANARAAPRVGDQTEQIRKEFGL